MRPRQRKKYLKLSSELLCVVEHEPIDTIFHELIQAEDEGALVRRTHIEHRRHISHQLKPSAHTGSPQPNISTTFIGKSSADELECSDMPISADPTSEPMSVNIHGTNACPVNLTKK